MSEILIRDSNPEHQKYLVNRFQSEVTTLETLGFNLLGVYESYNPKGMIESPSVYFVMRSNQECLSYHFPFGYGCSNLLFIHPEQKSVAYCFGLGIVIYTSFDDGWIYITANFGGVALNVYSEEKKVLKQRVDFDITHAYLYHQQNVTQREKEGVSRNTDLSFDGYFEMSSIEGEAFEITNQPTTSKPSTSDWYNWMPRYYPDPSNFSFHQHWIVYQNNLETPSVERLNQSLLIHSGHPSFPYHVTIQALIESPNEVGMHDEQEGKILGEIEDQLCEALTPENKAIPFFVCTQNSRKKWHFFVQNIEETNAQFESLKASISSHTLSITTEDDIEWNSLTDKYKSFNDQSSDNTLDDVVSELDALQKESTSKWKNIWTLIISVLLFISFDLFKNSLSNCFLLIAILLIHEWGHLIAMKIFKYKDLQMFFIPFFGAGASGVESTPSSTRRAIVALAGPIPGIIIGIGLGLFTLENPHPFLVNASVTFILINTFNRLPIYPFDGGRFIDAVLFSRHPKLEVFFKYIAVLLLLGLAWMSHSFVLGVFGCFIFFSVKRTRIIAEVAHEARKGLTNNTPLGETPSKELIENLLAKFRQKISPCAAHPKILASYILDAWKRIQNKQSSILHTILLIFSYLFFMGLGVLSTVLLDIKLNTTSEIVSQNNDQGETTRLFIKSKNGVRISENELNSENLFHGTSSEWRITKHQKKSEGNWDNGLRTGEWKFWDYEGNLSEVITFEKGIPVRIQASSLGELKDIPREDWFRYTIFLKNNKPKRAPQ